MFNLARTLACVALFFGGGTLARASGIDCTGHITNSDRKVSHNLPLKVSNFDKNYLRAELKPFSFGVDKLKLNERVLGLVILDDSKDVASSSYTGLRKIDGSDIWTTSLTQVRYETDGSQTNLELSCFVE